jgi:RNA polymerase sigma-70 factor (ECF subfamily)
VVISEAPTVEAPAEKADRDRDLVQQIRRGNLEAFDHLLRLHERRVLSTAVQMGLSPADAQDACQEVFLRVFRYLAGFRIGLKFEAWLWRIVVNVVYDFLKQHRDRWEVSWPEGREERSDWGGRETGLEIAVENADLLRKILSQMEILTAQERMVFVLRDLQDLDTAEVARAMRISCVTVRRHGSEARKKLRQALDDLPEGPD